MGYADEYLKGTQLTEEGILRDLKILAGYYQDLELEARVIPAKSDLALPVLLGILEPDEQGRPRIVNHGFLPLDTNTAEFNKYLQFYLELACPVEGLDRVQLLEAICRLNSSIPLGTCIVKEPDPALGQPRKVAVRYVQGFPLEEPIDQAVFIESLFLFDLSCDLASTILDGLAEGRSLDEAFAQIGR